MNAFRLSTFCSVAAVASVSWNCGKKKDGASSPAAAPAVSGLASAYPSGLALSVLPQSGTGAALTLNLVTDESKDASFQQKTQESNDLVTGKSTDCLPTSLKRTAFNPLPTKCYEFDSDMIYGRKFFKSTSSGNT
jgi:hypothetical protein